MIREQVRHGHDEPEPMPQAKRIASEAIATALTKLLPGLDTDYAVIAGALVDAVDLAAVSIIHHREQALQQCLVSLTEYYGGVLKAGQEMIAQLQSERADLILKLAASPRRTLLSPMDTKPTSAPSAPVSSGAGGAS